MRHRPDWLLWFMACALIGSAAGVATVLSKDPAPVAIEYRRSDADQRELAELRTRCDSLDAENRALNALVQLLLEDACARIPAQSLPIPLRP